MSWRPVHLIEESRHPMPVTRDLLRQNLLMLLGNGHAHMGFDEAVRAFPPDARNRIIPNGSYTPWHLLEHMRLVQRDSLNYMRNPDYTAPAWPDSFWPDEHETADDAAWNATIDGFRTDLAAFVALVEDEDHDLATPIPSNPSHTHLRSIMIIAAHNHYHLGEFAALRQVMSTWGPDHRV
jgi:hypothetical protein